MGLKSIFAQVYGCPVIAPYECGQPSAVIIMPVGQDRNVYLSQINTQPCCVSDKGIGLSRIKEYLMPCGLNIEAQPVFTGKSFIAGCVFHECQDLHTVLPR